MTQNFKQFIFHKTGSSYNTTGLLKDALIDGSAFSAYYNIVQLGVRALPGTKFYVNGTSNPVIIGFTGMFSIDLTAGGSITELTFDEDSIDEIEENDSAYLIVDIAYLGGN